MCCYWVGRLAGLARVLLCAWAGYTPITRSYFAGGFQVGALLLVGFAEIVTGCYCLLLVLTNRTRP